MKRLRKSKTNTKGLEKKTIWISKKCEAMVRIFLCICELCLWHHVTMSQEDKKLRIRASVSLSGGGGGR